MKEHRYIAVQSKNISATITLLQDKWNELLLTTPFETFFLSDEVPDFATIIKKNQNTTLYIIDGILCLMI